jgi:trimeric autotransporter adhesin
VKRLRPKLSYANVTATLALFIALSGASAYAANQLAARSVGERQLRPGAVTAEKIRKNAVSATKIKALAVKEGKLAGGSVTAAKLAPGAVGSGSLASASITNEKLAPGAVTGDKVQAGTLGQVPSAARADFATTAEAANPLAFAAVDLEGNLNPSLSKDVAVTRKAAGVYCISTSDFNPRGAQVTPKSPGEAGIDAYVTIGGTASCPAPGVEVDTYKGPLTSEPFYISLYR